MTLLSPHEFATLMLIRSAPDQIDMTRTELDFLLDRRLVSLEPRPGAHRLPRLTPAGVSLLEAVMRLARAPWPDGAAAGEKKPV